MQFSILICLAFSMGILQPAPRDEPNTHLEHLTLTLQCTNTVFKMGDEIPVEFVISNDGATNFDYCDRDYDRSGRMLEYALTVKSADGDTVPDPRAKYMGGTFGGLMSTNTLGPRKSFTKTIPLNLWAVPPAPGQYTVTGTYWGNWGTVYHDEPPSGIHSAPITITVLPRTEAEIDAYINYLTNHAGVDWRQLAFAGSPKLVPFLLNGMYHGGDSFWIAQALAVYLPHTEAIRKQILETASERGLTNYNFIYVLEQYHCTDKEWVPAIARSLREDSPDTWATGAMAAAPGHYDDSFTPRLIAMATGTDGQARDEAICALAANRTDASVETLKKLLNSPDENIRLTTEKAICMAYCYRGYYHGRKLKPEDFDKKFQQPSAYLDLVEGKTKP